MTTTVEPSPTTTPAGDDGHRHPAPWLRELPPWQRGLVYIGLGLIVMSVVRIVSGANDITSSGTIAVALGLAVPIGMAGLGGIFSERVGIVNIGLEGMMILGTWFGAYGAWQFGPWTGLLLGVVGGAIGGVIHAIATVTFNVDHIISGVAVNILAGGLAKYLSVIAYDAESGGSAIQSPTQKAKIPNFNVPLVGDVLRSIERRHWFLLSDVAGVLRGFTSNMSYATLLAILILVGAAFLLWRTRFGLRLRSIGENPYAAESLGVPVLRIKYAGVILSGMCAGFGGAFLAIVQASNYREGLSGGRGFIGLATMIFGNWRPGGLASGALLFGYSDGLQLRSSSSVPALFLLVAILCVALAAWQIRCGRVVPGVITSVIGVGFLVLYLLVDVVPQSLMPTTPYVVTLVVLATSSQRLRMPAADGLPYRRGEAH